MPGEHTDIHAARDVARQGERGNEPGGDAGRVLVSHIARLQPQPRVQTDASVDPDDDQREHLLHAVLWLEHPQHEQLELVAAVDPLDLVQPARADHMCGQGERYQQTEDHLHDLPARQPAQGPARDHAG